VLRQSAIATAVLFSSSRSFAAAGASRGRSLVYLYLVGGEDSNNLIVPLDSGGYAGYRAARAELALEADSLQPVTTRDTRQSYGFHPALPAVAELFRQGAAAIVANTGQTQASDFARSRHDYSWLRFLPGGFALPAWTAPAGGNGLLTRIVTGNRSNTLDTPGAYALNQRAAVMGTAPISETTMQVTPAAGFPDTSLGRKLAAVAGRLATAGGASEIYTCLQGGYDTHRDQLIAQATAYAELNDAVEAFYGFLTAQGLTQFVTLATATEFNRTLASNGRGGSDHGWGGQRLVVGGSVVGGVIHGTMPSLALGSSEDVTGRGVWRPSTSEAQLDSALGSWAGRSVSALSAAGLPPVSTLRVVI
jgi:uncharacterized protein (DUF1501 family)